MLLRSEHTFALAALFAPVALAQIREIMIFPFPDDKINATLTVNFDGYNITTPFSNSSQPTVPWQAQLDVRANVAADEVEGYMNPQDEFESIPYMAMAQIKLAYATEDSEDLEDVDESWGYCAAVQPLFNLTINATESVDPTCRGILEPQCLEFLTWEKMQWQYASQEFDDEDATRDYDDMATRVFVLLASWGEKNESRGGSINNGTFLNGTVMCLRANETTPGSKSMQEVLEDDASILGGQGAFSILTIASVAMFAVAL